MIYAVLLLGLLSQSFAFQCDTAFSNRVCGKYNQAAQSLTNVISTVDLATADAIQKMADETAYLFKTVIPDLSKLNFNGTEIRLDNNTVILVRGNMTQEQFQKIFQDLLNFLKLIKPNILGENTIFELLAKKIQELIGKALVPTTNAYSTPEIVKEHFQKAKESIIAALQDVSYFFRQAIVLLLNTFHGNVVTLTQKIDDLFTKFGINIQPWEDVKNKIDAILDGLKNAIANSTITSTNATISAAQSDVAAFFDELNVGKPVAKRSISNIWEKVKAAVTDLGDKIKDTTMKVVNENKDKVIDALNKAKNIVIDATKQIVIEISGNIVKVITDGLTGLSS